MRMPLPVGRETHSCMPALLSGSVAAAWSQGPEGVRGRNSENSLILSQLGWEPTVKLQDGLRLTYQWIKQQVCSCFSPFVPPLAVADHLNICPQVLVHILTSRGSHNEASGRGLVQLEAEDGDRSAYAKSTIVPASAPRELGTLRMADGKEGFAVSTE
jgi:GDP-D-mannose 3', 5'-epimerase